MNSSIFRFVSILGCFLLLLSCGGGGGGGSGKGNRSSLVNSSSSVSSVVSTPTSMTGRVTYDYVPHRQSGIGLDHNNTISKPVRSVLVELLDEQANILDTDITNEIGEFQFTAPLNQRVQIRVRAQLYESTGLWNVSVRDNTQNDSLYVAQGALLNASDNEIRNLHLASGWSGSRYSATRTAAPFAVLDAVYLGILKIREAGLSKSLSPLTIYWSENNTTAEGDVSQGEIGTSYFTNNSIYLLGDANVDTDEYDSHVILHEWIHYLESTISRADSIGGNHDTNSKLDMRLAFSEGLANSFSSILLDDALYKDAVGQSQSSGFVIDVSDRSQTVKGWYSQGSIESVFFNYYVRPENLLKKNMSDLFQAFTDPDYINSPGFSTIFLFSEKLQLHNSTSFNQWTTLLAEQNINSVDSYAETETNDGGYDRNLPVYKLLSIASPQTIVCSSNRNGAFNKLANYQFIKIPIIQAGNYTFRVVNSMGSNNTDPDIYLHSSGTLIKAGVSNQANTETIQNFLNVGVYILSLVEAKTLNESISSNITNCFQISLTLE